MMCKLSDQALDQWNALVEREETAAYLVQFPPHANNDSGCPAVWREKICEWCFQVVDQVEIDRDVVSIAMSYFDRYISSHGPITRVTFQLVSMTSLYLAVKLHSAKKISAETMSFLSRGRFTTEQILKTEIGIIHTLRWRLSPPTSSAYIEIANPLIEASAKDPLTSYKIVELSRYLLELCVCDSYFVDKNPSSVAYASILFAMEVHLVSSKVRTQFALYGLDKSPDTTEQCAQRIRDVISLVVPPGDKEDLESLRTSPTTVSEAHDL